MPYVPWYYSMWVTWLNHMSDMTYSYFQKSWACKWPSLAAWLTHACTTFQISYLLCLKEASFPSGIGYVGTVVPTSNIKFLLCPHKTLKIYTKNLNFGIVKMHIYRKPLAHVDRLEIQHGTECPMCHGMTQSHELHDSNIRVTWLVHLYRCLQRANALCAMTWLNVGDMTQWHEWHDLFISPEASGVQCPMCHDMTQSHMWHDSMTWVT